MRKPIFLILSLSTALVFGLASAIVTKVMPLGVRGEWEWLRTPFGPNVIDLAIAGAGVAIYAVFAGLVMWALKRRATIAREVLAVLALALAAVVVQGVAQSGAPAGHDLSKWVLALSLNGSSGYFQIARTEERQLGGFLARYPDWIKEQDALHIGTHPPGLIAMEAGLLKTMRSQPSLARFVDGNLPDSVATAFNVFGLANPLPRTERATLATTGAATLLACALTVMPLYLLARTRLSAAGAWSTAALWPLVPSAILFQPTADTAFAFLSTTALALAAQAADRTWPMVLAMLSGVVLAVGMQFSLVFLPVGLIVGIVLVDDEQTSWSKRFTAVLATGVGFLGTTLAIWTLTKANPFVIWWWNQKNHGRFYTQYPRSYWAWIVANAVELFVGLGVPISIWGLAASLKPKELPVVTVATLGVLAFLTLGGRSLSEVGRLWLPFMPALVLAAGVAMERLGAGGKVLAATVGLVGAETLILQSIIQVVYPV